MNEYDISRAFKRIENDLMDSMMRNLKRHQAEETELGIEWEQWQALQLKELERYRKENADRFTQDFAQINRKVEAMFKATCNNAQSKQESYILEQIKKDDFTPTQVKDTQFFNLNDKKLDILIERTKADFTRAEYAMLRKADDVYRQTIFDAQVYANVTNDYAKAVDMATHDFLKKGIQCVTYSNGAKHTISDYAEMCVRTGNKRAYLMGEGNAHDKYGIHTVRVNKRTQACPKCVKFLGRVLIDDVYNSGTAKEAFEMGVPTLSSAIQEGFLHPNCKDIYSLYIPDVSKPPTPWTQQEINEIVGDYNKEQAIQHANDMLESYARLAKYALDPENQKRYQARAQMWGKRAIEIERGETPKPVIPQIQQVFTDDEKEALEWYVSGDGMWINQYLRDSSAFGELNETETQLLSLLESATSKELEPIDNLYRSVDAKVIFEGLDETEIEQMMQHLLYGDSAYDKGAYSQGIKKRMEKALSDAKGKTFTEKGFMSTTVDKKVAEQFGDFTGAENPIVIELDTKGKKLKGANVDFLDIEDDPQRERILAKNTRYKINDIVVETDADGAKYIKVKAELLDQGAEVAEEVVEDVAEEIIETPSAFVPAKTIKEAEEFANTLGMKAYYKGVELDMANAMNESFQRGFEFCPSISERMKMCGSGQEANKVLKKALEDYYMQSGSVDTLRALGYNDNAIRERAKKWASRSVGRISGDTLAFARNTAKTPVGAGYSGIFVNNKFATFAEMEKNLAHDISIKFQPEGTDSVKAIFDHEMGHQLDYALDLRNDPEIIKIYRSMTRTEIKDNLSEYGASNIKEFIAEAYAEYINNPKPRKVAREIGEIITRKADAIR